MWSFSVWQLAVCGAVTMVALLLGFIYTFVRQKGMKSVSPASEVTEAQTDKWPVG